jgi:hypothetical protein
MKVLLGLIATFVLATGCASQRSPLVLMSHNPDGYGVEIWRLKLLDNGRVVEEKLHSFKPCPECELVRTARTIPSVEIPSVVSEVLEAMNGLPEQTFERIALHPDSKLLRVKFEGREYVSRRQVVDPTERTVIEQDFDEAWDTIQGILLGPSA